MREIKFRSWNEIDREMIILENSGLQYFDFDGSYSLGFTVDGYGGFWAHEQYDTATKKANKYPLMQFTGLKNKKGIEIYEGDIIQYMGQNCIVVFGKKTLGFGYHYQKMSYGQITDKFYRLTSKDDVIGNIHENPELLKIDGNS